jgi:hypothetical protein
MKIWARQPCCCSTQTPARHFLLIYIRNIFLKDPKTNGFCVVLTILFCASVMLSLLTSKSQREAVVCSPLAQLPCDVS